MSIKTTIVDPIIKLSKASQLQIISHHGSHRSQHSSSTLQFHQDHLVSARSARTLRLDSQHSVAPLGRMAFVLGLVLHGADSMRNYIGCPCGVQAIKISIFLLFPFGKQIVHIHDSIDDQGAQCCFKSCNCLLNLIWAVTVGWILAIQAFLTGIVLCLTIVGIPFGIQCFKLTLLCFCPFGIDFTAEEVETVIVATPTGAPQSNFHALNNV